MFAPRRLTFNVGTVFLIFSVLPVSQGSTTPSPPSCPPKSVRALHLEPAGGVLEVGVPPGERLLEVLAHDNGKDDRHTKG
jgi:hypothetical protein